MENSCSLGLKRARDAALKRPDVAFGVDRDARQRLELAVAGAFGAPLPQVFAFGVELLDPRLAAAT